MLQLKTYKHKWTDILLLRFLLKNGGSITVSQELEEVIKAIRENAPEKEPTIEEMRAGMEAMVSFFPFAKDIHCEPVNAGGISSEWVVAPAAVDAHTPLAAPLYADLTGLHPMLIQVGTSETLLDDAKRLAERAKHAGVDITLEPWEGMIHVWQYYASRIPGDKEAVKRIGSYILDQT